MKRVWHWLRRLFRRKPRWVELKFTALPRPMLADLCADGDFAATVGRPNVTVREVRG